MASGSVTVSYAGGSAFDANIRGHVVRMDQPDAGDSGPSPTEIFGASLAACMAYFAQRFLSRNGIDTRALEVTARFEMAEGKPPRIGRIHVDVTLPDDVPERLRHGVERVVEGCTVHNTLRVPPVVTVTYSGSQPQVA